MPWWFWPHLLSLEAPIVAVLWQAGLAHAHGLKLLPSLHLGLGLAAWFVYVLDRLWDTETSEKRHAFYARHRWQLLGLALPAMLAAIVWLGLWQIPEELLWQVTGIVVVTGLYFAVFVARIAPPLMPKAHAGGLIFALGCTSSIRFLGMPESHAGPLLECIALAFLFISNLTAIQAREEDEGPDAPAPRRWRVLHPALLGCHLLMTAALLLFVQLQQIESTVAHAAGASCVGLGLLAVLHRFRAHFSVDAYRVAVDLAVIAPLPLLWL